MNRGGCVHAFVVTFKHLLESCLLLKRNFRESHTRILSLLKVVEVQLKRLGGSHPLCSSQWRMAVPGEGGSGGRGEEGNACMRLQLRKGLRQVLYAARIIWEFDDLSGKEPHHTEGSPRTGHRRRETKLSPGPPDPSLDGLRAAVIDY